MSDLHFFTFDGDKYFPEDMQALLEAINEAISAEAWSDSDLKTDAEREEAISQSWDGTSRDASDWHNFIALMQHCPYVLDIKREELTLEVAVKMYFEQYFYELSENDKALKLAHDMIDWAVPEGSAMRDLTLLELSGFGNDGDRVLDAVDLILRNRD